MTDGGDEACHTCSSKRREWLVPVAAALFDMSDSRMADAIHRKESGIGPANQSRQGSQIFFHAAAMRKKRPPLARQRDDVRIGQRGWDQGRQQSPSRRQGASRGLGLGELL